MLLMLKRLFILAALALTTAFAAAQTETGALYFMYTADNFTTPTTVYRYDFSTETATPLADLPTDGVGLLTPAVDGVLYVTGPAMFGPPTGNVYWLRADGTTTQLTFTADDEPIGIFVMSPTGEHIAYSTVGAAFDVVVARVSDGRVVSRIANVQSPQFSPDGNTLLVQQIGGPSWESPLAIADVRGDSPLLTLTETGSLEAHFSPDGQMLAFAGWVGDSWDILTVDLQTRTTTNLTNGGGANERLQWSPDGTQVAYTALGNPNHGDRDIYVMNADGSDKRLISALGGAGQADYPRFSPDGTQLAYMMQVGDPLTWELFVADLATGTETPLGSGFATENAPTWLPDGAGIVALVREDGAGNLFRFPVDAGGSGPQRLTDLPGYAFNPIFAN